VHLVQDLGLLLQLGFDLVQRTGALVGLGTALHQAPQEGRQHRQARTLQFRVRTGQGREDEVAELCILMLNHLAQPIGCHGWQADHEASARTLEQAGCNPPSAACKAMPCRFCMASSSAEQHARSSVPTEEIIVITPRC
jgi:hypothetical protein